MKKYNFEFNFRTDAFYLLYLAYDNTSYGTHYEIIICNLEVALITKSNKQIKASKELASWSKKLREELSNDFKTSKVAAKKRKTTK